VEELNVKMAEARRKKRSNPDKADIKLYERLARLLSHIKDLWNGHQSLLTVSLLALAFHRPISKDAIDRSIHANFVCHILFVQSLQQKQKSSSPVVKEIGSVFESVSERDCV